MLDTTYIELKNNDEIKFKDSHKDYGRAEFTVCPIWKNGRLIKIYISTRQQEPQREFVINNLNSDSISIINGVNHDYIHIWYHGWCKEHKTQFFRFYVPEKSNCLQISTTSTFYLIIKGNK